MAQKEPHTMQHSNSYNIFILVMTVFSLVIMVVAVLPILTPATKGLVNAYNNFVCVIFLIDFAYNLFGTYPKSEYFIKQRGWLDLLGSIPSLGVLQYTALLRLFRISRLTRVSRLLRGNNRAALVKDVVDNRGQYTILVTALLTFIVLTTASVMVLQFESQDSSANIQDGGDSLWYSIVTITTVGYGDRYPITTGGRITATFIMFMGVGIIGVLASILSSMLVGSAPASGEEESPSPPDTETSSSLPPPANPNIEQELVSIKNELAVLQQMLENMGAGGKPGT